MRALSFAFVAVISMPSLAGAQRPSLFDSDSHFVQMDRHALVPDRVRAICPSAHPRDFNALIKEQDDFVDSVQKRNAPASAWLGLACRRALLYAMGAPGREGPMMVAGGSWLSAAVDEAVEALTREPANLRAAQLLSAIGLEVVPTRQPAADEREHLPRDHVWVNAIPAIVPRMAGLIYRAVQLGVRDSSVLRACTSLMFDAGDAGTAHDCSIRALALGTDSTWHLLRLTWLAVLRSDTTGAERLFASAMRAAHNPDARAEVGWHFEFPCQKEHGCTPGGMLTFRLSMDEKVRWLNANDSVADAWFATRLAGIVAGDTVCWIDGSCHGNTPRAPVKRTRDDTPLARDLVSHFSNLSYAAATFRACWPIDGATLRVVPCAATLNPYDDIPIDVAAQIDHLWDPATGNPVDLLPYMIVGNDLAAKDSAGVRTAFVDLALRRWGGGSTRDTAIRLALSLPLHGPKHPAFTGLMVMPTVAGLDAWSLMATQVELRHGGVYQDNKAPLDAGPLVLSDIVLGMASQGLVWETGGRKIVLAPQGVVARNEPVQLYYQVKSDGDRAGTRTRVSVFPEGADRATAKPAMQIAFDSPMRRGLNEVERELGVAKLTSGKYWIDVEVTDAATHVTSRRSVRMYVK